MLANPYAPGRMAELRMSDLKTTGQRVRITGWSGAEDLVLRLQEIGFHQHADCEFVGQAPLSGPLLIRLGSMVVALRTVEAHCLLVEEVA